MARRVVKSFCEMEEEIVDCDPKQNEHGCDQDESSCSSSSLRFSYSVNSPNEYDFSLRSIEKSGKQLNFVEQMRLKFELLKDNGEFKETSRFSYTRRDFDDNIPSEEEVDEISYDREDLEGNVDRKITSLKNIKLRSRSLSNIKEMTDEPRDDNSTDEHAVTPAVNIETHANDDVDYKRSDSFGKKRNLENDNRFHRVLPTSNICQARNSKIIAQHVASESCDADYSDSFDSDFDPDNEMQPTQHETQPLPKIVVSDSQDLSIDLTIDYDEPPEELSGISRVLLELIETEKKYVIALKAGIKNYFPIFEDDKLPVGLRGKKYLLFGNIEQIAEFHEMELLPMLETHKNDISQLCEEFCSLIESGDFYPYVLYTINKIKSEKLCMEHKKYLVSVENSVNDKLGVNSFLVQPVQRLPRYKLLLDEMIASYYGTDATKYKNILAACCRAHKYISDLLVTVNESVKLNDIEDCYSINLYYQGRFLKCDEFYVYDYTLRRAYKSLVFIFEKALIYTELIRDKSPQFRGFYACEKIGFHAKKKSFELYRDKRGHQQCSFSAEPAVMETWFRLITDMMNTFIEQEKKRLREKYSKQYGISISLRPKHSFISNRSSSDSGITVSTLSYRESFESNPRTTWYCEKLTTE